MTVRRTLAIALTTSVALAGLVTATTSASGATPTAKVQPRTSVTNTSAYAVIKTVSVRNGPVGVAVNNEDDTVYVTSDDSSTLTILNGRNLDDSVILPVLGSVDKPWGVAVDQSDDTVFLTAIGTPKKVFSVFGVSVVGSQQATTEPAKALAIDQGDDTVYAGESQGSALLYTMQARNLLNNPVTRPIPQPARAAAVNNADDTVYVSSSFPEVYRFGPTGSAISTIFTNVGTLGVAVDQNDDTVYFNTASNFFAAFRASPFAVDDTVVLGPDCNTLNSSLVVGGIAVDQTDDTVYVACSNNVRSLFAINPRNLDDTSNWIGLVAGADAVAVDDSGTNRGLVYVTSQSSGANMLFAVAPSVTPTLLTTTGPAGTPVTVSLTVPNLASSFDLAANTISSIKFGGTNGTSLGKNAGTRTWTVTPPAGSGTVDVVVTFNGGQAALAGTFTYTGSPTPPTPTPVYPPGAPTDVKATAGSGEATVSWTPPTHVGSFPITDYQVTSSTGSHTCLSKTTSCTVTGLTGGTTYTFTVRALNGAGWGPYSSPSNAVTPPAKTILITGSRDGNDDRYVKVEGTTTDLAGKQVVPWVRFPGQTEYAAGTGVRTVSADGTFTWVRKTGKKTYVYFEHLAVRSNTVTIAAR